jgi:uncharacterized protein YndB with AHSA1/START domain
VGAEVIGGSPSGRSPLRIERTFAAPAGAVFDAWISPDMLRRWWPAGVGWDTPVAEVDPRVGGRVRLVMRDPAGNEFGGEGEYLEIVRPMRLVFTWRWDAATGLGTELQRVEVDFLQNPDATTTVVLVNHGIRDEETADHREGWQASFDNLEQAVAGSAARG